MTTTTHTFEASTDALVVIDLVSLEGIMCDEDGLEEALRELNPDAPQDVVGAIEQLAFSWKNDECVADLMAYLNVDIKEVETGAFDYEYEGRFHDETYDSIKRRISAIWGFDAEDIISIDWLECRIVSDGDFWVITPMEVDYETLIGGRYESYSTDFVRNHCTSL